MCFKHTASPNYPGIYYLRGGDEISGAIHDELAETDERTPIGCMKHLAAVEEWGIKTLAKEFGRVHVVSAPGNHGRTTKKPPHKRYTDLSLDHLLAWTLEGFFHRAGAKNITFQAPMSGDAFFTIGGWKFMLTHGDRTGTGGGQGFVGPVAPIQRGMQKIRIQQQRLHSLVDFILMGHFHVAMWLQGGFSNGSLIGYNEYARDLRADPEPPSQWLLHVHPKTGIENARKVFVDDLRGARMDAEEVFGPIAA